MCTVEQIQSKELSTRLSSAFSTIRNLEADISKQKRRWLETQGCLDDECKQRAKLESELDEMRSKIEEQRMQLASAAQSEAKAAQSETEYRFHVQLLNDSINEKVKEAKDFQQAQLSLKTHLLNRNASEQREIEIRDRQIKALKLKEARHDEQVMQLSAEISKLQEVIDVTVEIKEHAVSEFHALKVVHDSTVANIEVERVQQKDSEMRHQEAVKSLSSQINLLVEETKSQARAREQAFDERLREATASDIVKLQDLNNACKKLKQENRELQEALERAEERHEAEKYWQQEYYKMQEELVACTESMHTAMEVTNSLPSREEAKAAMEKLQKLKVEKENLEVTLGALRHAGQEKEAALKLELDRKQRELESTTEIMEEEVHQGVLIMRAMFNWRLRRLGDKNRALEASSQESSRENAGLTSELYGARNQLLSALEESVRLSDLLNEARGLLADSQERSQQLQDRLETAEERLQEKQDSTGDTTGRRGEVTEPAGSAPSPKASPPPGRLEPSPRSEKALLRKLQREAEMKRVADERCGGPVTPPKVKTARVGRGFGSGVARKLFVDEKNSNAGSPVLAPAKLQVHVLTAPSALGEVVPLEEDACSCQSPQSPRAA